MVLEVPSQFSMGQTVQSPTCSIMEKPHTGLDDYLSMLLSCFREKMSGAEPAQSVIHSVSAKLFFLDGKKAKHASVEDPPPYLHL